MRQERLTLRLAKNSGKWTKHDRKYGLVDTPSLDYENADERMPQSSASSAIVLWLCRLRVCNLKDESPHPLLDELVDGDGSCT